METENDDYAFNLGHLPIHLSFIHGQNETILKLLTKNLSDSEIEDYRMFREFHEKSYMLLIMNQGQNPEGKTQKKLSDEVKELELKLIEKGLRKPR